MCQYFSLREEDWVNYHRGIINGSNVILGNLLHMYGQLLSDCPEWFHWHYVSYILVIEGHSRLDIAYTSQLKQMSFLAPDLTNFWQSRCKIGCLKSKCPCKNQTCLEINEAKKKLIYLMPYIFFSISLCRSSELQPDGYTFIIE